MEKKTIVSVVACALACACMAFGPGPRGGFGPAPMRHHSPSVWGRGGSNFWPGFAGGVVSGIIGASVWREAPPPPPPVVVAPQPVVYTTPVVTAPVVYAPPAYAPAPVVVPPPPPPAPIVEPIHAHVAGPAPVAHGPEGKAPARPKR